jgi:hypothetical protein
MARQLLLNNEFQSPRLARVTSAHAVGRREQFSLKGTATFVYLNFPFIAGYQLATLPAALIVDMIRPLLWLQVRGYTLGVSLLILFTCRDPLLRWTDTSHWTDPDHEDLSPNGSRGHRRKDNVTFCCPKHVGLLIDGKRDSKKLLFNSYCAYRLQKICANEVALFPLPFRFGTAPVKLTDASKHPAAHRSGHIDRREFAPCRSILQSH